MQNDLVKICPNCGSEFQLRVEACLDCGTALVHGQEGQGAEIAGAAGMAGGAEGSMEEAPPAIPPECVVLRSAEVAWIRNLSEDLDEAGIRHWITPPEWRRNPSLYVLPSDQEAAARIDRARYAIEVPEFGARENLPRTPVRANRSGASRTPSADDHDLKLCPSCGGEFQLWVEKCADCGIPLVRPWEIDEAREREAPRAAEPAPAERLVADDPGLCPACGDPIREGEAECSGCGLMFSQPETCPRCGADLDPFVTSCRRCGQDLFGVAEG